MYKDTRFSQIFLWSVALAACSLVLLAFIPTEEVEEEHACEDGIFKMLDEDDPLPSFGQDYVTIEYDFECLGPNSQPKEMNPGGRAIPSYSAERGNGTGRINYVYINPTDNQNVFACSPTGGLFVTYNNGLKWRNAGTDQLPVSGCASVVVNPDDLNNWVIATGDSDDRFMYSDGIWRTKDGGETWENINGKNIEKTFPVAENSKDWTLVGKVAAHPCNFNRIFVASNKGLFATNNAQEDDPLKVRWTRMAESFFYDIEIYPWDESVVYAAGEKFMVSGDCGLSWNELPLPDYDDPKKFTFLRMELEFTNQDPDHIYAAVTCADKHGTAAMGAASLHKFNIQKKEWTEVRSLRKGMDNMIPTRGRAFDISPLDSSLIVVGNVQPVYRSTNGGKTFDKIERGQMHDDIHHLNFAADGKTVWASHDGGVSVSFDGGLTFAPRDNGIGAANVFGLAVAQAAEPQVLYGGYDTGGNLLRDGEWFHVTWGDGFQTIIDHSDPYVMFATKQGGHINRTTDRGDNWDDAVYSGSNKAEWHTWIRMNPVYSNIIYCAGEQLVRSLSLGEEWETIFDVRKYEDIQMVYKIFVSESNPDVMYIYCLGNEKSQPTLYRTKNVNEETVTRIRWEKLDLPAKGWISDLVIDPDEWKKCWVSYKSIDPEKKVFRYTGEKWIDIGKKLGYARVESMVLDKNSEERLYLGSNYGVFTRSKREKEWTCLSGMPGLWMKSMAINYEASTLLIGTHGRGIWQCDLLPE